MGRTNSSKEGSAGRSLRQRRFGGHRVHKGAIDRGAGVTVDRLQTAVDRTGAEECRALKSARGISDKF